MDRKNYFQHCIFFKPPTLTSYITVKCIYTCQSELISLLFKEYLHLHEISVHFISNKNINLHIFLLIEIRMYGVLNKC